MNAAANGIPRPNIAATPAQDPNADRDPIPFGYGANPYPVHPQPQSYVPHTIAPESFRPSEQPVFQQAHVHQQEATPYPVTSGTVSSQPSLPPSAVQPAPQQQQSVSYGRSRRPISREFALSLSRVTGMSPEDCTSSIELLRDFAAALPPDNPAVASLLINIALELNT